MSGTTLDESHTPGPWQEGEQHESKVDIVCVKDGRFHAAISRVCIPLPRTFNRKEMQANARLIAAAPELLEALIAMLEMHVSQHNHPIHANARRAIAKAEGK